MKGEYKMKSFNEVHDMIEKLMDAESKLSWWDEEKDRMCCAIDALLWVIGDESGNPIDPDAWVEKD